MKEFTFRLKADVSYLEAQFKGGAEALKALAMQADKAEKKLEIFQEASTYLSQMDVMLGKIKKNYPDLFAQIFNGVDKQVKDAMAPFKQMPEVIGQALDNVGNKMQDVLSGKNKDATFSEVKEWAKSIEAAANALDIKVDLGFIEQAGASKKKVEGLVSVLKQLREAYHTTSDAAERANIAPIVPEVKPKRKRVPKKDTTVVEGSSGTGSGSATRHVENLTNSYIKLRNEIKKVKDGADFDKIIRDFKLTEDELGELENILYNTQDSLSDTMIKMREFLGSKFPEVSFENISDGIQKFLDIQNKLDSAETDEEFNKLSDEADEIRDSFVELSSAAESVFDGLMDGLSKDDAIKQLSDVFGVKMTQSFNNAEDAADGLGSEIKGTANEIENTIAKVKVLEDRLQEVLRNTKKHNIEFGVVLNGEDVSVRSGKGRGSTDGVQDVGNMLSSLEEYFINTHTHTTTSKYTNDEDMSVWANLKKYGVTDHNAIIGPDGATAFDFSKVSDEDMQKVIAKVKELGKSGNVTEEQLQEIFLTLDAGYTDVVKHFDATQMDEFAKYILNVSNNADNSIAPLERFKNIVSYFSDGTVDFSKWTKEFESFSVDKAEELFNKMIKFKEGGKIVPIDASKKTMSDVLGGITSGQSLEGATGDTNELRGALEGVESAAEGVGVAISDMDDELREVLAQETGSLEQKLERLRDVADEYGKDINQRKRNSLESLIDKDNEGELTNSQEERLSELQEEIDEADEALTAFEEQYDKIILKLANGKKIEILPNDKGLRDLYKFMDESFGQEFNGIEITDVEFIRKVAQSLGTEIPQAASGASSAIDKVSQKTEDLAAEATAAKKTFDALTAEVNENWYNMSDIDIGRNTQGLDSAIDQLRLLADQGAVTSEEMTKFEMAYSEAMHQLDMRKTSNEYDRDAAQDALKYGGYEDGYQDGYNNARNDYHEELDAYQNTINELRQELAEAQNRITDRGQIGDSFSDESSAVKSNIQLEIDQLERLEKKIFEVKHAVEQKIQAFVNEKRAVDSSITSEITALDSLITKLNEVKAAVDSKSDAFKQEDGAVKDSVKQATKKKKETDSKKQESVDDSKEATRYVTDKYGKRKTWYRGLRDSMGGGLVSNRYHGGTFFTDNLDLAKEYSEYTKVESANLSMMNPLEIDGNGANWNKIEYLGNSADEASIKIKNAREELDKLLNEWNGFQGLQINDLLSENDFNEFKSKLNSMLYAGDDDLPDPIRDSILDALANATKNRDDYFSVSNDDSNIYGTHDTNKFVEYAQNAGYDGVIFKNIIDSFSGNVKDMSNVIVAFNKDQIHYLDTISTDEKERKQYEFNKKYSNFEKYGEYDELRVSDIIKEITEFAHQSLNNIKEQLEQGFITETKADKIKEDIFSNAKDNAYFSALDINSPEFFDFIRTSEIDIWGKDANEVMQLFKKFVEDAHNEWNSLQNDIVTPVETNVDAIAQDTKETSEAQAAAEAKANEELREQAELKDKLIKQQGTLNYLEKEAKGAESVLSDTWSDGQAEEYNQILALISEYKKSKKLLSEEELQHIRDVVSGYQQQKKAIDEVKAAEEKRAKDAKAAEEKAKNAYGAKELGKATSTMEKAYDYGAIYKDSTKVQTQLETVRQTYAQLEAAQKELANSTGVVTEEQKQAFRGLVADFNKEYGILNNIVKESEKLIAKSRFTPVDIDPSVAADMNKLEAVMKQAVEAGEEGKVRFGQFNATLQTMEYQVKDTNGQWVTFLARLDSTGTKVVAANSALKKTNTLLKDIASSTLSKMKSAIGNITGYDLIYRIINVTKQGIQYVREIDSALTELKKVTDETEESYRNFLQTASKTAAAVGSTVKDITTMTADWSRLGLTN